MIAGLGLGLVIAPLSAVALRSVPALQHGIASAAVVVARMMGMLIGVAALSAWGFHKFPLADRAPGHAAADRDEPAEFARRLAAYLAAVKSALHTEYTDIFWATAALCVAAALLGLAIGGRGRPRPPSRPDAAPAAEAETVTEAADTLVGRGRASGGSRSSAGCRRDGSPPPMPSPPCPHPGRARVGQPPR